MASSLYVVILLMIKLPTGDCTFGKTDVIQNIFQIGRNRQSFLLSNLTANSSAKNTEETPTFTTTIILREETKNESTPSKAHGYILLEDDYEKLLPPKDSNENFTSVDVRMLVASVTKIDSKTMMVGLEIKLSLGWKDGRINWPKGKPQYGERFLLDPYVLR